MQRDSLLVLGLDTSGPWCSVALLRGQVCLASEQAPMARGQAEALMPILADTLAAQRVSWDALAAIGVGVGPGNFTGIRIAVAAARGLALGLGRPAIGVSTFEAILIAQGINDGAERLVTVPAPRGQVYAALFAGQRATGPMQVIDPLHAPVSMIPSAGVLGHRATEIAAAHGVPGIEAAPEGLARHIARSALARLQSGQPAPRPAPLYIRPADAAPPREAPVPILP